MGVTQRVSMGIESFSRVPLKAEAAEATSWKGTVGKEIARVCESTSTHTAKQWARRPKTRSEAVLEGRDAEAHPP